MSREYPCVYYDNEKCQKFTDDKFTSWCVLGPCGEQKLSNADRIRAMNDEELAWELMTWRIETCARLNGAESPYPHTQKSILDWLKQPVKEDNDG